MWKNYLKSAFRNIWREKGYTLINVLGLSIGMAACIFIFIYIYNELNYDKWYPASDRIYRVIIDGRISDDFFEVAVTGGPFAAALKKDYPEILEHKIKNRRRGSSSPTFVLPLFFFSKLLYN